MNPYANMLSERNMTVYYKYIVGWQSRIEGLLTEQIHVLKQVKNIIFKREKGDSAIL